MPRSVEIRAWRPRIPGVIEVLHARMTSYDYPMHVHDEWTLLIVDHGLIRFDIERSEQAASSRNVTLLPPGVPHNGSTVTDSGFHKRVVYLDTSVLPLELGGAAAASPVIADAALTRSIAAFHHALGSDPDSPQAESRLALVTARLRWHLGGPIGPPHTAGSRLARDLRDLFDDGLFDRVTLDDAAGVLHAHPAHLVRAFTREFGIPPHQYVISRRISAARRLLLAGMTAREVGVVVGFCDQAHFTRRFKQIVGTTPASFGRGGATPARFG